MIRRALLLLLLLAAPAAMAQTYLDDGFEAGSYTTNWDLWLQSSNCTTDTSVAVNATAARSGSYGVDIRYVLDDDPRGDCQLHQDNNTCLVWTVSPSLDHYFVRGYFKLAMTQSEMCTNSVQRKILYFKPPDWGSGAWAFMVNLWNWPTNCTANGQNVSVGYGSAGGTGYTLWGDNAADGFVAASNHVMADTWYYIELEVEYRTFGTDILRIWLAEDGQDPVRILERTNLTLRSEADVAAGRGLGIFEMGRQVDLTRTDVGGVWVPPVDEHRYWDDVVIASSYIGPVVDEPTAERTTIDLDALSYSTARTPILESSMFVNARSGTGAAALYQNVVGTGNALRIYNAGSFEYASYQSQQGGRTGSVTTFHDALRAAAPAWVQWQQSNHDKIILTITHMPLWLTACPDDTYDDTIDEDHDGTPDEFYYRVGNTWEPSNFTTWEQLVADFVNYWAVELPATTGHTPELYFEIWNEPESTLYWRRGITNLLHLYNHTAVAVKATAPTAKMGGLTLNRYNGVVSGDADPALQNLAEYVVANALPLDFLSWHIFSDYPGTRIDGDIAAVKGYLDTAGLSPYPAFVISEWNNSSYYRGSRWQTGSYATYFAEMYDSDLAVHTFAAWEDWSAGTTNEYGLLKQCGLVCDKSEMKGVYEAFLMMLALTEDSLGTVYTTSPEAALYEGTRRILISKKSATEYTIVAWENGFDPPTAAALPALFAAGGGGAICQSYPRLEDAIWSGVACPGDEALQAAYTVAHETWEAFTPKLRSFELELTDSGGIVVASALAATSDLTKAGTTRVPTVTVAGDVITVDLAKNEVLQLDLVLGTDEVAQRGDVAHGAVFSGVKLQ